MYQKIRILRIIGQCRTGGTESVALSYYNNIDHDKFGVDFLFYGDSNKRFNEELSQNGDIVFNVTDYRKSIIKSIIEIRRVTKEGNYDIVHAQLNTLNLFPLLGARLGGANVRIAANHSSANLRYETKKSILKYLFRPTSKWLATDYASCSRFAGEWCFGKRAMEKGRIKIIRNAIDLSKFSFSELVRQEVRNKMGWGDKCVIGHVGRFTEQKNHHFIVKVFYEVQKRYPNSVLVLVGDGHLLGEIREFVGSLNIADKVQFLGLRFDINELMQGMDVFLFPSLYEGLGNVIIEAQAVGLPSVVSHSVPKEAVLTPIVEVLPIEASPGLWADVVLDLSRTIERNNTHEALRDAGYEIKEAARELEDYYISLVKRI